MQQYNVTPTEEVEQVQLFEWAQWASGKYPELGLMHHIPNGGKRGKGGRLTEEQKEMIPKLRKQGYRVEVCFGMEAARDVLIRYLEG